MAKLGWRYYILFRILDGLFVMQVCLLFPETKSKWLEELEELEGILDRVA